MSLVGAERLEIFRVRQAKLQCGEIIRGEKLYSHKVHSTFKISL